MLTKLTKAAVLKQPINREEVTVGEAIDGMLWDGVDCPCDGDTTSVQPTMQELPF